MKKLLLIALLPAFLLSCQSTKKEEKQKEEKEITKEEREADVKASTLVSEGQKVPDFSFTTTDGEEYSMKKLEGKVVLLNFFATWCPTCMKEMPVLQEKVWGEYKNNSDFFMVSIGREHSMDEMKEFKTKKGYNFNLAPDTGRIIYSKFAEKYIPRNLVIDKQGNIAYENTGYTKEEFSSMLQTLEGELNK